jgi:hypothetical protein
LKLLLGPDRTCYSRSSTAWLWARSLLWFTRRPVYIKLVGRSTRPQALYCRSYFKDTIHTVAGSRGSSVGIATGYGLDDRGVGVRVLVGSRILFSTSSGQALGPTQPPIQWVPGVLSPAIKRPGREAHHSPPRKCGSIRPLPHTPSWRST